MDHIIKINIRTLSNLFIGGTPMPFEIGGIDQWTAVDGDGFPCIPASSLKGALRAIVMEDQSAEGVRIAQWYAAMLSKEKDKNWERIQKTIEEAEARSRIEKRYEDAIKAASPCNLFGIREFNNTPKLLFNDMLLKAEYRDLKTCFSIDTKTAIDSTGGEPKSNPRTYKTARVGLEFEGEIELYRFGMEYFHENAMKECKDYIIYNLKKFNEGTYRLGNSKSRGYGKVFASILGEDGGE